MLGCRYVDVTTGHRWFTWLCQQNRVDPITTFREEVAANFHGKIKGPFNEADRLKAVSDFHRFVEINQLFRTEYRVILSTLSGTVKANVNMQGLTPAYYEDLVGHMGSKHEVEKAEGDEHVHPRLT